MSPVNLTNRDYPETSYSFQQNFHLLLVTGQLALQLLSLEKPLLKLCYKPTLQKKQYLFLLLLEHVPKVFNHTQIDPPFICVPLVPGRRMEQGFFKHGAQTGLLQVHSVDVIVGHHSPSCL